MEVNTRWGLTVDVHLVAVVWELDLGLALMGRCASAVGSEGGLLKFDGELGIDKGIQGAMEYE